MEEIEKLKAIIDIFEKYSHWAIKSMGLGELYIDWINDDLSTEAAAGAYDRIFGSKE